jgi:hypothetical protein
MVTTGSIGISGSITASGITNIAQNSGIQSSIQQTVSVQGTVTP